MTKGLRCGNCDSTIHRKAVLDFILNQTAPYLRCKNTFCNVRWKRSVLEEHKAQFLGEDDTPKKPTPKPTPKPAEVKVVHTTMSLPRRPAAPSRPFKDDKKAWLARMRHAATEHAKKRGVVTIDVLRQFADANNDHPPSPSAWGSVFQTDEWTKVSEVPSTRKAARSRKVSVWALTSSAPVAVAI